MPHDEKLEKSIDELLDEVFSESFQKGDALDLAQDSSKTADEALKQVPKAQSDESRGAGRPTQISDIPQTDMDGAREGEYDDKISENEGKEDQPEEAKKQAQAIDQSSDKGHMSSKPSSPKMAPFKKSEDEVVVSKEEYEAFQAFKKSQEEAKAEELRKSEAAKEEELKKSQEALIKSAVESAVSSLRKENQDLRKSFEESQVLLKALSDTPEAPKSITHVQAIEKSSSPSEGSETFSKSEILDAAMELAKSGKIAHEIVTEIEMTDACVDSEARSEIERFLQKTR